MAPSTLSLFVFIIDILAQEYETLQMERWQKEWKRLKPEVKFVHPVSPGGSVKFLPAV